MQSDDQYDYIILGAGLSGLSLAYRLTADPYFNHEKILVLDRSTKQKNDRTWCFWNKGEGEWEHLISKKWGQILFKSDRFTDKIDLDGYAYNKIEGRDFYEFCLKAFAKINADKAKAANVTFKTETVVEHGETSDHAWVRTETNRYEAKRLFTSIAPHGLLENQTSHQVLHQHFIGWFIKTNDPFFDPGTATFMDFSVPQKGNTRFMYVLPTSPTEALVEYTLFSEKPLPDVEYEDAIKDYLAIAKINDYAITATERGNIPMTAYPFEQHNTARTMYIGSAGGWTRGSTGFTFSYTQKWSARLVDFLKQERDLNLFKIKDRYRWYDLLFLDVLYRKNQLGATLFATMFKKNPTERIFRFLDGESTLADDLKIMWNLPKKEFVKAFFKKGI